MSQLIIAGNAIGADLVDEFDRREAAGEEVDLTPLRLVMSSGVLWGDDVKQRFLARGSMMLLDTLAASEGGPFAYATGQTPDDLPSRFVLVAEAEVFSEDGRRIEPGFEELGLLAFRGGTPLGHFDEWRDSVSPKPAHVQVEVP